MKKKEKREITAPLGCAGGARVSSLLEQGMRVHPLTSTTGTLVLERGFISTLGCFSSDPVIILQSG